MATIDYNDGDKPRAKFTEFTVEVLCAPVHCHLSKYLTTSSNSVKRGTL